MAFLTKKEQTLINAIKSKSTLQADDKVKLVQSINYNARLRQDGYRRPIREFIQAMANHNTDSILKLL